MAAEDITQNAVALIMNFDAYLSDNMYEMTGYVRYTQQDEKNPSIVWEDFAKPDNWSDTRHLCNLDAGKDITHNLHKFFNKHLLLGSIKEAEIYTKAGDVVRQTFGNMIFEQEAYGITDLDAFSDAALNTQDQLEVFFSAVMKSGIRDWSKFILSIQVKAEGQQAQPNTAPGANGGFFSRFTRPRGVGDLG